nr:MAG: hypothetical protein DIU78_17235 [Pseudomonadota bacterium]
MVVVNAERPPVPPPSLIAAHILAEAVKPDASLLELAALAQRDPNLTLRLLALVNSAAFGLPMKVADVRQAATMVGLRGLRNLALSLVVTDMAPLSADGEVLLANSLRRAAAAQLIASATGERAVDEYFTAGLLLEVGLIARARDSLPAVTETALQPAMTRVVMERAEGAVDHPTRGAQIARDFQLPRRLIDAVARHHDQEPPEERLALIAWAAERTAAVWESGSPGEERDNALSALARVGLDERKSREIFEQIPDMVNEAAATLGRRVPRQQKLEALLLDANRILSQMNRNYEGTVRKLEALLREKEELMRELQEANARLLELTATDTLTGLLNKRSLDEALARDLARADRTRTWLGIVFMDVDHFKAVNDTRGHQVGDAVLKAVARIVMSSLRAGDIAARYGGEEFVAVLPGSDVSGAIVVAERIRHQIEATPISTPSGVLRVTASFGVAAMRGPGCRGAAAHLLARADAALYAAKGAGRNRVVAAE